MAVQPRSMPRSAGASAPLTTVDAVNGTVALTEHHRAVHVMTRYLRGGSERRARDMMLAFPEAEHHVVIGADSDVELAREHLPAATITVLPSLVREPNPYRDLAALRWLRRHLRNGSFEVVVTHQSKAGVLGRTAAHRYGIPVIHSLSMPSFGPGYPRWQSRMFSGIETRLARSTDAFAVVGADVSARYESIGVPSDKLHVVRSGVALPGPTDPTDGIDVREELGLPLDTPLLVYVGSLDARKNVLDLPRLLARVRDALPETAPHLAIAGDGPLGERLEHDARALGLRGSVTLLGYLPDPLPLLRCADLAILLSSAEGVPQVLVQAAAVGTPFVAYGVDGVGELIELGADGVAIVPGDLDGAVRATLEVLGRPAAREGSSPDLSAWGREAIARAHRGLFLSILGDGCARCTPPTADALVDLTDDLVDLTERTA